MAPNSRVDAIAIRPSYAHYLITGYEIKVSRADFLGDTKWPAYLKMCHQLYFCTPHGVVDDISEIPETCGLLEYRGTESRPFKIIKKAPIRDIDSPEEMYKYLLFKYCNAQYNKVDRVEDLSRPDRVEVFKKYLADKAEFEDIGFRLSKKLREDEYRRTREIRNLRANLESEKTLKQYVNEIAVILGIDPDRYWNLERLMDTVKEQISRLSSGVSLSAQDISDIRVIKNNIDILYDKYVKK